MDNKVLCVLSFLVFPLCSPLQAANGQQGGIQQFENPALKSSAEAADQWLNALDQGKYDDSWQKGSATLKLTVPQQHWVSLMESIRKPLGSLASRNLVDQRTSKDPAGLPKGDYMVLVYKTAFSQKKAAHELLTMVQERDGNWRVLTYQVQ